MNQIFENISRSAIRSAIRKKAGLGLAIVRRLPELIDAEVNCRLPVSRGTVFEISLPLRRSVSVYKSPIPADVRRPRRPVRLCGRRIVVIDDDVLVAKSIEKSLGALGMPSRIQRWGRRTGELGHRGRGFLYFRLPLRGVLMCPMLNAIQQRSARPINAVLLTGDIFRTQTDLSRVQLDVLFKPVDLSSCWR